MNCRFFTHALFSLAMPCSPILAWAEPQTGTDSKILAAQDIVDPQTVSVNKLASMSLEQLMNLEIVVTSSSRQKEQLKKVTSSIYVLTADTIRRSGIREVPELMRLVPGMHVIRQSATTWAISTRGFNAVYNNKMLVLVDGRSVYANTYSGVYWDQIDLPIEDIERIEVIRGPGGTLWGTNAVNGVINIITKNAQNTKNLFAAGGGGTRYPYMGELRGGGAIGNDGAYRIWGKNIQYSGSLDSSNQEMKDSWLSQHGGFRADWTHKKEDVTVIANAGQQYENEVNNYFFDMTRMERFLDKGSSSNRNANGLIRWNHRLGDQSEVSVQSYYDWNERIVSVTMGEWRNTADVEIEGHFSLGACNQATGGAGYRRISDQMAQSTNRGLFFDPIEKVSNIANVYVQDEQALIADHLFLTAGIKLENNDFTGNELQPSGRILWTPSADVSFWSVVSKVARLPSRVEDGGTIIYGGNWMPTPWGLAPFYGGGVGNKGLKSETLLAYEAGTRLLLQKDVSLELSFFYNHYDRIIGLAPGPVISYMDGFLYPMYFSNMGDGNIWGGEANINWNINSKVRFAFGYSEARHDSGVFESGNSTNNVMPPRRMGNVRANLDLIPKLEINTHYSYTGKVLVPPTLTEAPYYQSDWGRLDVGMTYMFVRNVELSVWGQDILQKSRKESIANMFTAEEIRVGTSYYLYATTRF